LLISHSCGHLLRTVCSVSNALIKINIKQIANIPRRGRLICWRILPKTSQRARKTLCRGEAPTGGRPALRSPYGPGAEGRCPGSLGSSPLSPGRWFCAPSLLYRDARRGRGAWSCPARARRSLSALRGADQRPPPANTKASINRGRLQPSCRAPIRIEISLGKWICV